MIPSFGEHWMSVLLPVLDEFLNSYQGRVNHEFWQAMVKHIDHGKRSGSSKSISGWINLFYPYLGDKGNRWLKPWRELAQSEGPDPGDFPRVIASTPVVWNYYGDIIKLEFHAGMLGAVQDTDTLALRPRIGWGISKEK